MNRHTSESSPTVPVALVVSELLGGGAEQSMSMLHQHLYQNGYPTLLIALNSDSRRETPNDLIITLARKKMSGLFSIFSTFVRYRKVLRGSQVKTVVLNCELAELIGSVATPRGLKIITVEHTSRPWVGRRLVGLFARTLLEVRGVHWITVNAAEPRVWPFQRVARVIRNPISVQTGELHGELRIAFVGRLSKDKRPDLVARVAKSLQIPADFFGTGHLLAELKSFWSSQLISFFGFVENVWELVPQDSLVIVPSAYEGDGRVVAEAIARGNPLLLADNEDLRRFSLPERNYFLNELDLEEKLFEAKKTRSWMSFVAPAEIRDELIELRDIKIIGDQWLSLLDEPKKN